ncbi:ribonuclease H-like domain-containing protein [Suillus ampliporus]|nr:ribonuclease H-like domain-containing protein [Suillus ampliporus]
MPEVFRFSGPPISGAAARRRFVVREGTHPLDLFVPAINACTARAPRFIHTDVTHLASVLIFVDGAAVNENTPDARAGCGLYFEPGTTGISMQLENIPGHARTRNRAELRAAIAALQLRVWPGEGFMRVVIGTHAEYVVNGVCQWVPSWKQRGWKTRRGEAVKNRDLWEMLLEAIEKSEADGIRVQFYLLKKEWNTEASGCARRAAVRRALLSDLNYMLIVVVESPDRSLRMMLQPRSQS